MELRKQENNIERRVFAGSIELRKDAGDRRAGGYAARFNSVYDMGWFTEEVDTGAFDGADMADVVVLFNHDPNIPLGRTSAGTATLRVDSQGLGYDFDSPDSPNGSNVLESIRRGDVTQSSWGFTISDDTWEMRNGKDHRIIKKVARVFDVSPVTFPANPDTSVAKRSMEMRTEIGGEEQPLPPETTNDTGNRERRLRLILIQNKTQNKH